jgi:hypothetical protein
MIKLKILKKSLAVQEGALIFLNFSSMNTLECFFRAWWYIKIFILFLILAY